MAKAKKKKLDLATAEVADGALIPDQNRSVYELCGINTNQYRERTADAYQARLEQMDLIQLHDEAYKYGVAAIQNRNVLISRLVAKFSLEKGRFNFSKEAPRYENVPDESDIVTQANKILSVGRNRV